MSLRDVQLRLPLQNDGFQSAPWWNVPPLLMRFPIPNREDHAVQPDLLRPLALGGPRALAALGLGFKGAQGPGPARVVDVGSNVRLLGEMSGGSRPGRHLGGGGGTAEGLALVLRPAGPSTKAKPAASARIPATSCTM